MATDTKGGVQTVAYMNSKMAQQSFLSSARVSLIFTYNTAFDTDVDAQNAEFLGAKPFDALAAINAAVGAGYGAANRAKIAKFGGANTGAPKEIVVGAGFRSVNVEQQINVTQEGALGAFDILETIEHNVASNTMTVDKMVLRLAPLSTLGVAAFGKGVLTSPALNCYIYDPIERQRGYNYGYLKVFGMHLQSNRFSASVGSVAMENVTFRPTRIQSVKNALPPGMLKQLAAVYPSIYSGIETFDTYSYQDLSAF